MEYILGAIGGAILYKLLGVAGFGVNQRVNQSASTTIDHELQLLQHAPFPVCTVSASGVIRWSNDHFKKLSKDPSVTSKKDLERMFNAEIKPIKSNAKIQQDLFLPTTIADQARHFSLLRWSISNEGDEVFCFHEQTFAKHQLKQRLAFEHQIFRYLETIGSELHMLLRSGNKTTGERLEAFVLEIENLSKLMLSTHELTRITASHSATDLKKVLTTIIGQYRSDFEKKDAHLVKTFPHHVQVRGTEVEYLAMLQILMDAVLAMLPKHSDILISLEEKNKQVMLKITLPKHQIHQNLVSKPYNFATAEKSIPTPYRIWRAQLAIVHQMAIKHYGSLKVTSDSFEGTRYIITLAAKDV